MIGLTIIKTIYVSRHVTDMRKSIDGLCGCVEEIFNQDPVNGNLFVFFNRRMNMVKMLLWSKNGFCIFMKRLEKGTFSIKSIDKSDSVNITELLCILDGIELHKSFQRSRFSLKKK